MICIFFHGSSCCIDKLRVRSRPCLQTRIAMWRRRGSEFRTCLVTRRRDAVWCARTSPSSMAIYWPLIESVSVSISQFLTTCSRGIFTLSQIYFYIIVATYIYINASLAINISLLSDHFKTTLRRFIKGHGYGKKIVVSVIIIAQILHYETKTSIQFGIKH